MAAELEAPIFQYLMTQGDVTALIGTRFFPDAAPPGAEMPYAVHEEAERLRFETLTGYVNLNLYLMHIDCYAATRGQAKAVRRAVSDALESLRGPLGGVFIHGVFFEGADVDEEPPRDGSETPARRAGLDLRFGYSEN